jgi:glucosamine kinase
MVIIADSGSSTTNWAIINKNQEVKFINSNGLNPLHLSENEILSDLELIFNISIDRQEVRKIIFYGAGCISHEINRKIELPLSKLFPNASIEIDSDITAASIALFGNDAGISCILGTGANVAFWDGTQNHQTTASLGYILGDEGSGAYIGKKILTEYLRKNFSEELHFKLCDFIKINDNQIIQTIYKTNESKRFLASVMIFAKENIENEEIQKIIYDSFQKFIQIFILKIENVSKLPIGFCGSIAFNFEPILQKVMNANNLKINKIVQNPLFELVEYFKEKQ